MMTLLLTTLALAPLQCDLSVKAQSRVNEPLPLVMTLTNRGEGPLEVLSWFTPFEGWFADAIDLTLDDRPIPYKGPLAKRGNPGAEDFFLLGAGQQSQRPVGVALGRVAAQRFGHAQRGFGRRVVPAFQCGADVPLIQKRQLLRRLGGQTLGL